MIRNTISIALRSMRGQRFYTIINIIGLATGIACSALIGLWIKDELTWNGIHSRSERIYQLYQNTLNPDGIGSSKAFGYPIVPELDKYGEVETVVPLDWGGSRLLTYNDKRIYKRGYHAGSGFLETFDFPIKQGTNEALSGPSSIVITESTAIALFGNDDYLGKTIRLDNTTDLKVTAVIADPPGNSTFQFDCLIPFETYLKNNERIGAERNSWGFEAHQVVVMLREGVDVDHFREQIRNVTQQHQPQRKLEVDMQPMPRWRLYGDFENGKDVSGMIVYVQLLGIVAAFILAIACINFINLATARTERRLREVGIRKAIGSQKIQLVFQFLVEATMTVAVSYAVAIAIVVLALPSYNTLVDKHLSLDFTSWEFWAASIGVIVTTSVLAGTYPAFYLSSFRPVAALRGLSATGGKPFLRKFMVTFQFCISVVLVVITLVVHEQIRHLKGRPLGYDPVNLMSFRASPGLMSQYEVLSRELISKGLVESTCKSLSPVTNISSYAYTSNGNVEWPAKKSDGPNIAIVSAEFDYIKTMGIRLLEGRDFSEGFNDTTSVIINKRAAEYMEMSEPIGEKIKWFGQDRTIIGVTENVVMKSPTEQVEPLVILFEPHLTRFINLRLTQHADIIPQIQEVVQRMDPDYPFVYEFSEDVFKQKYTNLNQIASLSDIFSGLAITISCLGLLGLVSFVTARRKKEIGIRKVLGASVPQIVLLLSRDFIVLVLIAFVIASPLAYWGAAQWLSQFYYRASLPLWLFAVAGISVAAIALITMSFQSVRAAMTDPAKTLKND